MYRSFYCLSINIEYYLKQFEKFQSQEPENWTNPKGMNFEHDFDYSFHLFSSPLKKRGKMKRKMN